jgi:hypothetical protein
MFREMMLTKYKVMARTLEVLFSQFPDILEDVGKANKNPKPLVLKIRKVCLTYLNICTRLYAPIFCTG